MNNKTNVPRTPPMAATTLVVDIAFWCRDLTLPEAALTDFTLFTFVRPPTLIMCGDPGSVEDGE
jgi:hypothetical protein